jgi:hypothetical protein
LASSSPGAAAHIDNLSELYLGKRPSPIHDPHDTRVIFRIEPTGLYGGANKEQWAQGDWDCYHLCLSNAVRPRAWFEKLRQPNFKGC